MPKFLIILQLVYVVLLAVFMEEKLNKLKYVLTYIKAVIGFIITANKEIVIAMARPKQVDERNKTVCRCYFFVAISSLFLGTVSLGIIYIYPFYQHTLEQKPFG